jgi:hypothetical protein
VLGVSWANNWYQGLELVSSDVRLWVWSVHAAVPSWWRQWRRRQGDGAASEEGGGGAALPHAHGGQLWCLGDVDENFHACTRLVGSSGGEASSG